MISERTSSGRKGRGEAFFGIRKPRKGGLGRAGLRFERRRWVAEVGCE